MVYVYLLPRMHNMVSLSVTMSQVEVDCHKGHSSDDWYDEGTPGGGGGGSNDRSYVWSIQHLQMLSIYGI